MPEAAAASSDQPQEEEEEIEYIFVSLEGSDATPRDEIAIDNILIVTYCCFYYEPDTDRVCPVGPLCEVGVLL